MDNLSHLNPDATSTQAPMQVVDDIDLLDLMMSDLLKAPSQFQPTNYWKYYEDRTLPEIKARGLSDFRRSRNPQFNSFGAVDLVRPIAIQNPAVVTTRALNNRYSRRIPGWIKLLNRIKAGLANAQGITVTEGLTPDTLRTLYYGYAENQGNKSRYAKPLDAVGMSLFGNPEDVFSVGGRQYSLTFLHKYLRYAFASQFIDFEGIEIFVELGCGSGKQIELLKKLHPNATYLVFDIPPQLYVAHQYLTAAFPGSVVPYKKTRELASLDNLEPGMIYIFGTAQYPLLETINIDLFWNAASFQEMEPEIVENYLTIVNRRARAIYLQELTGGMIKARAGEKGVLNSTTRSHYVSFLPSFDLINLGHGLPQSSHDEMFWQRRSDVTI